MSNIENGPQGLVLDGRKVPSHPLVVGRTEQAAATSELPTVASAAKRSIPTALEIATTVDRSLANDIARMDGESGMQVTRIGRGVRSADEIATTVDPAVLASVGSMEWGE